MSLLKLVANKNSSYYDFSTGNVQTLLENPAKQGLDISKELRKFYDTYYSANMMKL